MTDPTAANAALLEFATVSAWFAERWLDYQRRLEEYDVATAGMPKGVRRLRSTALRVLAGKQPLQPLPPLPLYNVDGFDEQLKRMLVVLDELQEIATELGVDPTAFVTFRESGGPFFEGDQADLRIALGVMGLKLEAIEAVAVAAGRDTSNWPTKTEASTLLGIDLSNVARRRDLAIDETTGRVDPGTVTRALLKRIRQSGAADDSLDDEKVETDAEVEARIQQAEKDHLARRRAQRNL